MFRKALFTIICALMLIGAAPAASACGSVAACEDVQVMPTVNAKQQLTIKNGERMRFCIAVAGGVSIFVTFTVTVIIIINTKKCRRREVERQLTANKYITRNGARIVSRYDRELTREDNNNDAFYQEPFNRR